MVFYYLFCRLEQSFRRIAIVCWKCSDLCAGLFKKFDSKSFSKWRLENANERFDSGVRNIVLDMAGLESVDSAAVTAAPVAAPVAAPTNRAAGGGPAAPDLPLELTVGSQRELK